LDIQSLFYISDFIIIGATVALILFKIHHLFWPEFSLENPTKIIAFTFLIIAIFSCGLVILDLVGITNKNSYFILSISRATGPYWWLYLFIILSNTILPYIVLIKQFSTSFKTVVLIGLMMNGARIMEWIVLQSINVHIGDGGFYYAPIVQAFIKGLVVFAAVLIILQIRKRIKSTAAN